VERGGGGAIGDAQMRGGRLIRNMTKLSNRGRWTAAFRRVPEFWQFIGYRLGRRRYSDFYAAMMNRRVRENPARAVGGKWDLVGRQQFEFVKSFGLQPTHSLLDFGCGAVRAGLHFVGYLEPGNYAGVDISAQALAAGRSVLHEAGLDARHPTLRQISDLSFDWFAGRTFHFVIAQHVLNHMPFADIDTALQNLHKVLTPESVVILSFTEGSLVQLRWGRFFHSAAQLSELAARHGFDVEVFDGTGSGHDHGKHLELRLRAASTTNVSSADDQAFPQR
jgi:SAM-dependent methyltransferase